MILNRSHNFVFIHIPKTAGSMVSERLGAYTRVGDAEIGGTPFGDTIVSEMNRRFGLGTHSTAAEVRSVLGAEYANFFSFAFARNPYARAYSLYRYQAQWSGGPNFAAVSTMRFEDYIFSDYFTEGHDGLSAKQTTWTHESGKQIVDHVGRLEGLKSSLLLIVSLIERKPASSEQLEDLQRVNSSTAEDEWKSHVMGEAKKHIATVYAEDFQAFGYDQ
jgi:hypothetical protein